MHLYVIRHGQSHVNLAEWESGNTDEGLTELGQRQAAALGRWLPGHVPEIDALYTSTMRRALETAEHVAKAYDMTPRYEDRLREIGNNRWDHSAWPNDELPREYADYWSSERPFSTVTPLTLSKVRLSRSITASISEQIRARISSASPSTLACI